MSERLPNDDVGNDFEDLPTPPEPSAQRRRLLIAAAVLVPVALIVVAILRFTSSPGPSANPAVTVTASGSRGSSAPTPVPPPGQSLTLTLEPSTGSVLRLDHLPVLDRLTEAELAAAHAECPRLALSCVTTGEAPTAVVEALRTAFPTAGHVITVSDIGRSSSTGPRLVYRRVSARAGPVTISIRVRQLTSLDAQVSQRSPGAIRVQIVTGRLAVELQVSGSQIPGDDLTGIEQLAADPRLLAIG